MNTSPAYFISLTKIDEYINIVALLYVFVLIFSILAHSWIGDQFLFYILTLSTTGLLLLVVLLGNPKLHIDSCFFTLFFIYSAWILIGSIFSLQLISAIQYTVSTIIIFVGIVIIAPFYLAQNKYLVANIFSYFGIVLTTIGFLLLLLNINLGIETSPFTGRSVWVLNDNVRIASVFQNSNNLGKFLCISSISSLYLLLAGKRKNLLFLVVNFTGLILTNGQGELLGFVVGATFLVGYQYSKYLSLAMIIGIVGTTFIVANGFVDETPFAEMLSRRNYLWRAAIHTLSDVALFGTNFTGTGEAIKPYVEIERSRGAGVHNSYLAAFLNVGMIGGICYIISLFYILFRGSLLSNSLWVGYIIGSTASLFTIMTFSTFTLGGLAADSILLATFVGLTHYIVVSDSYNF